MIKMNSFNPRARAGRDRPGSIRLFPLWCFNPRARAGRDRAAHRLQAKDQRFNPRARAGRDRAVPAGDPVDDVSIHAPARGATAVSVCDGPT